MHLLRAGLFWQQRAAAIHRASECMTEPVAQLSDFLWNWQYVIIINMVIIIIIIIILLYYAIRQQTYKTVSKATKIQLWKVQEIKFSILYAYSLNVRNEQLFQLT